MVSYQYAEDFTWLCQWDSEKNWIEINWNKFANYLTNSKQLKFLLTANPSYHQLLSARWYTSPHHNHNTARLIHELVQVPTTEPNQSIPSEYPWILRRSAQPLPLTPRGIEQSWNGAIPQSPGTQPDHKPKRGHFKWNRATIRSTVTPYTP